MTEKLYTDQDLRARLALAMREVAEHQASDYNGGAYDWVCHCGAVGHWIKNAKDSWQQHILSLCPDLDKALAEHDAALIASAEAKARLEEAKWWDRYWDALARGDADATDGDKRIADLEKQKAEGAV